MNFLQKLPLVGKFFIERPRKNFMMGLWSEINSNVERYYVVEQRQFITDFFDIEAWEEASIFSGIHFPKTIHEYARGVADFNKTLKDMKDFEGKYCSSIDQKTRDNAEILHKKKEAVQAKFELLRPKIMEAQKSMRDLLEKKHQYR